MNQLPIFMNVSGRAVLVAGGTSAALAKLRLVARAGAVIRVIDPAPCADLDRYCRDHGIAVLRRSVGASDMQDACIVYVATGNESEDARIAALAEKRGVPVNVVDRPHLCSFTTPAVVDRSPVVVAVGTNGTAPVLAQRVRAAIDRLLPVRLGVVADVAESFRPTVRAVLRDSAKRRRFWQRFFDGAPARAVLSGDDASARTQAVRVLNETESREDVIGAVALVAIGPGDPDLLTLKAHRLLLAADVIVHDGCVGPDILELARRDAEVIVHQDGQGASLLDHLADLAREGMSVVHLRLGASVPGHEVAFLKSAGVAVFDVPGVSAPRPQAEAPQTPVEILPRDNGAEHGASNESPQPASLLEMAFPVPFLAHR